MEEYRILFTTGINVRLYVQVLSLQPIDAALTTIAGNRLTQA